MEKEILHEDERLVNICEINLWRAVINQAFIDLRINSNKKKIYKILRRNAAEWLTLNSEDFLTVCEYACLNPEYVRRKAIEVIKRLNKIQLPIS